LQVIFLGDGADLDAFSTGYGITVLYPKAKILIPSAVSTTVRLAYKRFENRLKDKIITYDNLKEIDTLFLAIFIKSYLKK